MPAFHSRPGRRGAPASILARLRPLRIHGLSFLSVVAVITALVAVWGYLSFPGRRGAVAEYSLTGLKVLLVREDDASNQTLATSIARLESSGFQVITDSQVAISLVTGQKADAFLVARSAFNDVPSSTWVSLYKNGTLIGGIDVSLHELQPLAIQGSKVGPGRLRYTPGQPIFSLIYGRGCLHGAMSDWLKNWDIAALVEVKLLDLANAPVAEGDCLLPPNLKE